MGEEAAPAEARSEGEAPSEYEASLKDDEDLEERVDWLGNVYGVVNIPEEYAGMYTSSKSTAYEPTSTKPFPQAMYRSCPATASIFEIFDGNETEASHWCSECKLLT